MHVHKSFNNSCLGIDFFKETTCWLTEIEKMRAMGFEWKKWKAKLNINNLQHIIFEL